MMSRPMMPPARSPTLYSNLPASKHFLNFLKEREGCAMLGNLEENLGIDFRVGPDSITVHHDQNLPAHVIDTTLKQKWHECAMQRATRVLLLHSSCAHSHAVRFTVSQAAIIYLFSHNIIRDSGISDIIVETNGNVCWFGPLDCVNVAQHIIERIIRQHLSSDDTLQDIEDYMSNMGMRERAPSSNNMGMSLISYPVPQPESWGPSNYYVDSNHSSSNLLQFDHQSVGSNSDNQFDSPNQSQSHIRLGSTGRRKDRLLFNVRSTDAPRLIGTRGINKKRIEEATGCSITLHTESKKDGEFPVEVVGGSQHICESAKVHIEMFLMNGELRTDEDKKLRERPKIHLAFSPKKLLQGTSSSVPAPNKDSDW